MKMVIFRSGSFSYVNRKGESVEESKELLDAYLTNSAGKKIGAELARQNPEMEVVQWRFWSHETTELFYYGLPMILFQMREQPSSPDLERHIERTGQPDLILAEGLQVVPSLERIFELCPDSLKFVYPKHSQPWVMRRPDLYHLCLVDEEWQIEEMRRHHPDVRCAVWDKLIDYEEHHFPMPLEKVYDICYVAHLKPRKNHDLLLRAVASMPGRKLKCVFVGRDDKDIQSTLEALATELGVDATFAGNVTPDEVNRYMNQSRMGVICSEEDAVPRAMLEYMAADIPVMVNSRLRVGTRYVGPKAGLLREAQDFASGIEEILDDPGRFRPREHLLENFSREKVCGRFLSLVEEMRESAF